MGKATAGPRDRTCRACGASLTATAYEFWLVSHCAYCAHDTLRAFDAGWSLVASLAETTRSTRTR